MFNLVTVKGTGKEEMDVSREENHYIYNMYNKCTKHCGFSTMNQCSKHSQTFVFDQDVCIPIKLMLIKKKTLTPQSEILDIFNCL